MIGTLEYWNIGILGLDTEHEEEIRGRGDSLQALIL
jgi:hypothetical protein